VALAISSLLLLAGGAILVWGVSAEVGGLDIDVVGWILMVVGLVGAAFALMTYARGRTVRSTRRDYLETYRAQAGAQPEDELCDHPSIVEADEA
jgi:hypothetical protein